jgi:chromosome segregation ATPase
VSEQQLQDHLEEAHRQLLDRDYAYRFHEEELRRRDQHIDQLRQHVADAQAWARELEANIQSMQETRAWRLAVRLRSLHSAVGKLVRR